MPQFDITLAGEANLDMVFYGLPEQLPMERELVVSGLSTMLGGSAAITAHNLAALGSKVGFIFQAGDDPWAEFCQRDLEKAGVDLSQVVTARKNLRTGVTVFLQHGNRRQAFTHPGAISELRFDDLDLGYLSSSRHFHLSSLFLQRALRPDAARLLAAMQQAGVTTSLDTNDDPSGQWEEPLLEVLKHVDIFLPNANEACHITRQNNVEDAARELAKIVPLVVLKLGNRGAFALHDGKRYEAPALEVCVVDTVGAGDSFNAGFLHSWIRGGTIQECLELGNLCGAYSTTGEGGISGFQNVSGLKTFVARHAQLRTR